MLKIMETLLMSSFDLHSVFILVFTADALTNGQIIHRCLLKSEKSSRFFMLSLIASLLGMFVLYFIALGALYVLQTPSSALKFTSGVVILISGLRSAFNKTDLKDWETKLGQDSKPFGFFAPVAMPTIVGPSWFAAALLLIIPPYSTIRNLQNILCAWFVLGVSLILMHLVFKKFMTDKFFKGFQAVIGLVITIIGVQIILDGLQLALIPSY